MVHEGVKHQKDCYKKKKKRHLKSLSITEFITIWSKEYKIDDSKIKTVMSPLLINMKRKEKKCA